MRNLIIPALASLLFLTGCSGYKLGQPLPENIDSVFVPTVVNASKEPLLETSLTPALQREIITYSQLRLAEESTADATLQVRVIDYRLDSIGYSNQGDKNDAAREYRAWIKADAKLVNTQTGEIISEAKNIVGKTTFIIDDAFGRGDIVGAKRASKTRAARDLAREIVDAVMEVWN